MRCLTLLFILLTLPAWACSPSLDYLQKPYQQKLSGSAFLGKVTAATEASGQRPGAVTFTILASRGEPAVGATETHPVQEYGTCGKYSFHIGEVWLYSGDEPFGATMQPTAADLGDDGGKDFAALIERINQRLQVQP